jgi:hypothetical protein
MNEKYANGGFGHALRGAALQARLAAVEDDNYVLSPDPVSTTSHLEVYDAGDIDPTQIPPRAWLLGVTFARQFLSGVIAEGGTGKTAVRYAQFLALASGRNLTGEHVHQRCHVLIVCLEDNLVEVKRRIAAAMLHHGVSRKEIRGYLFYCTPKGLKLLFVDEKGAPAVGELHKALVTLIRELKIDLVAIDPFVKSHGVGENDNNAIDAVCTMLANLADEFNIAVDFAHHARKGAAQPGDGSRSRGASSSNDAGRLMRTLTAMNEDEAKLFGLTAKERPAFIRYDDAKVNLTIKSGEATWFKLVGVHLGNCAVNPLYPRGDHVQTVEPWTPPDIWKAPTATIQTILDEIDTAFEAEEAYSNAPNAKDRPAWKVVTKHLERTEPQAREMIREWVKNDVLTLDDYTDKADRKKRKGLKSNPAKRPG